MAERQIDMDDWRAGEPLDRLMALAELDHSTQWKWVIYLAAALSLLAASMHGLAAPEHFREWWGYGAFMVAAAAAQTLLATTLLRRKRAISLRQLALAGITGNLAIIGLYVLTRTAGIPLVGPGAGEVEPVREMGGIDVICTLSEIALVAALAALLARARRPEKEGEVAPER